MSLHELPKEIVHSILRGLMSSVGVPKAFELRCVNKSFDENIQIAAFTLPICSQDVFCNPWPDPRTSSPIMSRFVLFKTTPRGSTKRLTKTIEQTLSFYALHLNVQPLGQASWRHSLATAMVEFLPVQEVVRHLNTDSVSEKKENFTTLENALIGSIYNEDERAVVYFLQKDARPELQTAFFGDALSAAARRGNARIFRHVLRHLESMVSLDKQVFRVRILKSFVIASENGYLDVILELLEHTKPVPEFQELLESAISTAVRNSHRRVVRLLLSFVDNAASDHHRRRFSSTLLENAVRSRNAELVQDVLECLTRGVVLYASDTIKALEIAVQYQLTEIARSILRYMPVNEQDLSQQQMLYWAGRKGNAAILDLIMPDSITSNIDSIFDFLSGAVKREVSDRAALLEKVLSRTSKDADLAGSFSEVVDQILEDGTYLREASSRSVKSSLVQHSLNANLALETNIDQAPPMAFAGPFASQSPPEAILLVQACSEGQMRCVGDLLRVCKAQYGDENLTILYACFTEAIRHQKPAVLSYLLERLQQYFPPDIGSHCKSTAMFQILLDSGWNINHIGNRLHPPALGFVIENEHLTRWFLANGADPNARGDWDITAMSMAVMKASMSTLQLLLKWGADVHRGQLLHFAVRRDRQDIRVVIDWLLGLGLSITSRQYENDPASWLENKAFGMGTPLHIAVQRGDMDTAQYLIAKGADINKLDSIGRSAREIAESKDFTDIVEMLKN